jgi:hypothetical protein
MAKEVFGKEQPQQSMGAVQAAATGIVEGVKAFVDGIGQVYDLAQSSPTLNAWAEHGTTELASGLVNGNAFLPYGWGGSHGQSEKELADQAFGRAEITDAGEEQSMKQGLSM